MPDAASLRELFERIPEPLKPVDEAHAERATALMEKLLEEVEPDV